MFIKYALYGIGSLQLQPACLPLIEENVDE